MLTRGSTDLNHRLPILVRYSVQRGAGGIGNVETDTVDGRVNPIFLHCELGVGLNAKLEFVHLMLSGVEYRGMKSHGILG
ncbi:hypothetical protein G6F32_015671 [Rhizopus arrhizus]|nr:hypothetical protein G6F32_015671 [Rhizopus arrhizus]